MQNALKKEEKTLIKTFDIYKNTCYIIYNNKEIHIKKQRVAAIAGRRFKMKLQNKEVYRNYVKNVKPRQKNERPSVKQDKQTVLFAQELDAVFSAAFDGKFPKWMEIIHDTVSGMDLPKLDGNKGYTFRVPTNEITLIVFEWEYNEDGDYWEQKELSEEKIYEGDTTGHVKIDKVLN